MSWTDASRLETYQNCPRRYQHKYIHRLVPKEVLPSPSASFGLGIHAGLESLYKGEGADYEPCRHYGPPVSEATCLYCQQNEGKIRRMFQAFLEQFPPGLEERSYTQHNGLLLLTRYVGKYQNDPLRDGCMGVELTFNESLEGVSYVGRIDLMTIWDGVHYVVDHKTKGNITDGYIRSLKLDAKTTGYLWAISTITNQKVSNCMINIMRVSSNIDNKSFARPVTSRTETDIQQWKDNALRVLDDIARDEARDYFPMNSNSCFSYNRECEYYRICTATANPEGAISQFYDVKPPSEVPSGLSREVNNE